MTKQSITRIYAVTIDNKTRLIEAASGTAALAHVAKPDVRVASQRELLDLVAKGVTVEVAGKESAE